MVKRVGLLGGTFDPPHIGHLVAADQVRDRLDLDEVRLVVNNQPWQKLGSRLITPAEQRLELVVAAVADSAGLVAESVELDLGGPSYTVITLEELRRREPETEWLVIVGADAAAGLATWHRADELRRAERFVVVDRPGTTTERLAGWRIERVAIPSLNISSTELRELCREGRSVRHLTPDRVIPLLDRWGLYRQEP